MWGLGGLRREAVLRVVGSQVTVCGQWEGVKLSWVEGRVPTFPRGTFHSLGLTRCTLARAQGCKEPGLAAGHSKNLKAERQSGGEKERNLFQ